MIDGLALFTNSVMALLDSLVQLMTVLLQSGDFGATFCHPVLKSGLVLDDRLDLLLYMLNSTAGVGILQLLGDSGLEMVLKTLFNIIKLLLHML